MRIWLTNLSSTPRLRHINSLITGIVILGSFLLLVIRTLAPFPATSDQAYFLPASFVFADGGKLANPWLAEGLNSSLNWHGFLQPYIIGLIARAMGGGWTHVYLAVNLLAAGTFILVSIVLHNQKIRSIETISILLMTFALLLDIRARPELLATAETVLLFFILARNPVALPTRPIVSILVGFVLAALLATQPVIFGFTVVGIAIYILQSPTYVLSSAVIGDTLRLVLLALATFACVLLLFVHFCFEGPIGDWLKGLQLQAASNSARSDFEGFAKYYLANRFVPGLGVGLLLLLALASKAWHSVQSASTARLAKGILLVILLVLATACFFRFAIRIPATYYNFSGILVAVALTAAVAIKPGSKLAELRAITLVILGLSSLLGGGLWLIQALIEYSQIRPTAQMLAADIASRQASHLRTCGDAAALPAIDNMSVALSLRVCFDPQSHDGGALCSSNSGLVREPLSSECDVYFALQDQNNKPGLIPDFQLRSDHFVVGPLQKFHLRPLYFGYARYEKQ
jgi:hypothetical protein